MSVPVICVVGFSGSGKTTLVEQLIPLLSQRGLRVATIKNAHHRVQLDTPGKDSWRYKQAGAVMSMLVTGDGIQLIASHQAERDPQTLAQRFMGEVDLVLAEGFSSGPAPKIEVLRRATDTPPRCSPAEGLVALVTDRDEVYPQLPHFALDDLPGVVDFVLNNLNKYR